MKIHLAWIRATAAAALVASISVQPASAQYAPFKSFPPAPVTPAATAPAPATAATTQTAPYGAVAAYPQTQVQAPTSRYQAPTTAYQVPVAPYQPAVAPYAQAPVAYPQTAARYPAAYPRVAEAQPAEANLPAPQTPANTTTETMPAPAGQSMSTADPAMSGYPTTGCNCGTSGCTTAGCSGAYPDVSGYFDNCGSNNQWFGGVYWLFMNRDSPEDARLTVQLQHPTSPDPYYPPQRTTVVSSQDVDYDFRSGLEVRLGSTFTVGGCDACDACGSGSGYPGCGCNSCGSCGGTMYAWEFAWWGLDDDGNSLTRWDDVTSNTRIYGMKNFAGLSYDRDGAGGTYNPRNANYYYGYNIPIPGPSTNPEPDGGNYIGVLAQRVYTNFKAQNLELNIIRFPACNICSGGCDSGCGCGYDAGGCNSGCGCDQGPSCCFSMYGSCGVRYFRIDDDFGYDTEFGEWNGGTYDHPTFDGWGFDNSNELCYDINIDNNLIGPQIGWTNNYCYGCRWNFFLNSTMGVFDNQINQWQRMWSGGGGTITLADGSNFNVRSHKNDIAFLGELRAGCAYAFNCHWRGVLAYRAVAMTGIATSVGQIPDNFSSRADVAQINADSSLVIHGVQIGAECMY